MQPAATAPVISIRAEVAQELDQVSQGTHLSGLPTCVRPGDTAELRFLEERDVLVAFFRFALRPYRILAWRQLNASLQG